MTFNISSISAGSLDPLLQQQFAVDAVVSVIADAAQAAAGSYTANGIQALTAYVTTDKYAASSGSYVEVTAVNDSAGTIAINGYAAGQGAARSTETDYVIGISGNSILLSSETPAQVAAALSSGNSTTVLNTPLEVLITDGSAPAQWSTESWTALPTTAAVAGASTIVSEVASFIADQNQNRGGALAGGGILPLDYDALTGSVPAGGNAVTGIGGISAGAAAIALPASQFGNAVIVDGAVSTSASTSGTDSYSFLVGTNGTVTLTDNNTGNSETITGDTYLVFDGGAKSSTGAYQSAYIIETGVNAEIAEMYNAALGRVPDFAGLEYYAIPIANGSLTLHQAATYFLASPEFAKLYPALTAPADNGGPNDQTFITELYGNILHRTPSAAEVQYYVGALQGTLTTTAGTAIPGVDRAQLLIYFSISPENQQDVAASSGGWLINPANGSESFGTMSVATATTVLSSDVASGTVSASDFSNLSSSAEVNVAGTSVIGATYGAGGAQQSNPEISTTAANITVNLSSQYYMATIDGANDTVNGASGGGSIILLASTYPGSGDANNGGTVNLSGNANWIEFGNPYNASSVLAAVHGWNSSDILVRFGNQTPNYATSASSLLASPNSVVLQGDAAHPINGASYAGTSTTASQFSTTQFAINVGTVSSDSVAAIVTAANQVYKVGDVFTPSGAALENMIFFGEDPQGNTVAWYWRGDSSHAGTVLASDITGGVELVGVQASSLTAANFHH
jgi:hypothetical protein